MLGGKREGAGRPKGYKSIEAEKAREYLVKRVMLEFGPILDKQIELALAGDRQTIEYLLNQTIGKPKESVEVTGEMTLKIDV